MIGLDELLPHMTLLTISASLIDPASRKRTLELAEFAASGAIGLPAGIPLPRRRHRMRRGAIAGTTVQIGGSWAEYSISSLRAPPELPVAR
jgi:hypothetical protein